MTVPVTATDGGSGVTLLEVYNSSSSTASSVVNASTRAYVGTGDAVLIVGFVIEGTGSLPLLVRAVGPTLAALGVSGALADLSEALPGVMVGLLHSRMPVAEKKAVKAVKAVSARKLSSPTTPASPPSPPLPRAF